MWLFRIVGLMFWSVEDINCNVSLNVGYGEALKKGGTQGEEIGKGRILSNLVKSGNSLTRE